MLKIVKSRDATVTARHYAFLDFEKFGLENWMPDFFGLIRDPVNRLISSFYYTRAAWNIVGKMEMFPQFKPPPVKYLRQDFESCVLKRKYLLHTYSPIKFVQKITFDSIFSKICTIRPRATLSRCLLKPV